MSIEDRPKAVEKRIVPGHLDGDLIVGTGNRSAVGTPIERTMRYTIPVPLKAKHAVSLRKAYAREMRKGISKLVALNN